jgi:hypothetical protein
VLLGTSPRILSVCFINVLGSVIPTFWVLSLDVVLTILLSHILLHSYKSIARFENFLMCRVQHI